MRVVPVADAPAYITPKHEGVTGYRLQSPEHTGVGFCSVGVSYYSPGGVAEMDAGPQEKVYVVVSGEISVRLASGENSILRRLDSCLIGANERREVRNNTNREAIMLVITPPPSAKTT
ncbi:MAG: cupin domain-containing protein [Pseudomonadota bacterium]|nr:cupin domain-containing protein [Pseudomonadota bacterium]